MKYLGVIQDPKDLTTKEYVDDADTALSTRINTNEDNIAMAETDIESLQGDVNTLKTDNTSIKAAVQTLQDTYVPNTRKINNKPLDADITLSASDVGTVPAAWNKINDGVDKLVISGSSLGGEVELGFLLGDDGYYYGDYQQNAYIRALYNGKIEVSTEPTTDMGIVNKKFLESKLDIFWAIYGVTTYQEVDDAFKAGKKIFLIFVNNDKIEAVAQLTAVEGNAYIFIQNKLKTIYSCVVTSDGWSNKNLGSIVPSVDGGGTDKGKVPVANAVGGYDLKKLTASDVGALPDTTSIPDVKVVTNVSCPLSAWVSDTTTYANYPFKANLTVTGATADYIPLVNFAPTEQESGNFVGSESATNIVTIWAKEIPSADFTIPNVVLMKGVSISG